MITTIQQAKAERFLGYHKAPEVLVLLNSWDVGSSRLIAASGYKAIATTSMGVAASLGYPDGQVIDASEMLEAITRIVQAVDVPVTVDMEAGYGRTVEEVVATVDRFVSTGIVGINIEDSLHMNPVLIDETEFCERLTAIRQHTRALGLHLVINARTDSFYTGAGTPQQNLAESIRRGNLYHEAGADCIFVQPVWDRETIATLVKEIDAPVNILANPSTGAGLPPSVAELQALGVARLSLGSSLMKATLTLIRKVAAELAGQGTYQGLSDALTPYQDAVSAYKMATGS